MKKSNSNTNNIVVHILICTLLLLLPTLLKGEIYTITWSVAGNTTLIAPTEIESENMLGDLPIPNSNCQDKVFYGWTTESSYAHETEPPTCIKETTIPNASTTYYAVFANQIKKEKSTWDEIELNNINSKDSIGILMVVKSSNGNLFHYALTNVTDPDSDLAQATSVQNIEFTQRQIWSIHHNIDFTFCIQSRFNTEQWLSDVRVSNINTNRNFIFVSNHLYNIKKEKYIGINFDSSGQAIWYIYASPNSNQAVHFFKKNSFDYQNFATSCGYDELAMQVVEWKKDAIVVMYNGDPDESVNIYIKQTQRYNDIPLIQKDHAIYEIPIPSLDTCATQSLQIVIGNAAKTLDIPIIVHADSQYEEIDQLISENANTENADIVVLNAGECNLTNNTNYSLRNIHIYGGGKLAVGNNSQLNASSIIMRVGSVQEGKYVHAYPQLLLQGQLTNETNVYVDFLTTYDRYYSFSIPYIANTQDIKYPIDIYGEETNTGSFQFEQYNGTKRAAEGKGWETLVEPANLIPYKGYTFWGAPKKVSVNNANPDRQQFGIHRIPLNMNEIQETTNKTIPVYAYGDANTPDNDRGWNFIGTPFLTQYKGLDSENIQIGILEKEMEDGKWTGKYHRTGDLRYITQTEDGQVYTSTEVSETIFYPFNSYFVQIATEGLLSFNVNTETNPLNIPQKIEDEIKLKIELSCHDHSDQTGILIAEPYSNEYEFNADLSKFENEGLTLYSIGKHGKLAYMAINNQIATSPIHIGYKTLTLGIHTIKLANHYHLDNIKSVNLIDKEQNITTNLLENDYSFTSQTGTFDQRFILQLDFHESNYTDLPAAINTKPQVYVDKQTLRITNIGHPSEIIICDLMGRILYEDSILGPELITNIQEGVYLIRITSGKQTQLFKIISI
jgi:hypothetical protein